MFWSERKSRWITKYFFNSDWLIWFFLYIYIYTQCDFIYKLQNRILTLKKINLLFLFYLLISFNQEWHLFESSNWLVLELMWASTKQKNLCVTDWRMSSFPEHSTWAHCSSLDTCCRVEVYTSVIPFCRVLLCRVCICTFSAALRTPLKILI